MATTILIVGATGKQGGAVITALLAALDSQDTTNTTILALTRNATSPSAVALAAKSSIITLLTGTLDDPQGIFTSSPKPITRIFAVSMPSFSPFAKPAAEERPCKALIDAAVEHGVEHFVFTSVDRHGEEPTDVPHFISKANIEAHLKAKAQESKNGMTWTILRPTAFMDNFTTGFAGKVFPTAWNVALSRETKLCLIATADIGWFGAQALLAPKKWAGRAVSLAGDQLTFSEANEIFRNKFGKNIPLTWGWLMRLLLWAVDDLGKMFKFFEEVGYEADIGALRREHPGLLSLSDSLETSAFARKST